MTGSRGRAGSKEGFFLPGKYFGEDGFGVGIVVFEDGTGLFGFGGEGLAHPHQRVRQSLQHLSIMQIIISSRPLMQISSESDENLYFSWRDFGEGFFMDF